MKALLEEGQMIRETYEVERFLGQGAFAEVYRVQHQFMGRQAMKVFKRLGMTLGDIREQLGEALLLSKIPHDNIVRVFDANTVETEMGRCGYFTMELVTGGSLEKFWNKFGGRFMPVTTAHNMALQVCRGLAVAHTQDPPIVHRDIKPQNILVSHDGKHARLSDFGLAKAVNPLTLKVTAAGTLAFKAPEVFVEDRNDSCTGDVWALGTVLYMLLTDKLPHKVDPELGWTKNQVFKADVVVPSSINPNVDGELDRITMRAISPKPEDRYASAIEILADLEKWKPVSEDVLFAGQDLPKVETSEAAQKSQGKSGPHSGPSTQDLVNRALVAKSQGNLPEAAELMSQAIGQSEQVKAVYAKKVELWRRGIEM